LFALIDRLGNRAQRAGAIDLDAERHAAVGRRRVCADRAFDHGRCLVVLRQAAAFELGLRAFGASESIEHGAQRRPPRALPCVGREQRAAREERGGHGGDQRADLHSPPRAGGDKRRNDEEGDREAARKIRNEEPRGRSSEKSPCG
jgi:hypothetical protein